MAKTNSKVIKKEYVRLEARVLPELKILFAKAAGIQGINLTNFIVSSAKKEAESVLKEHILINLSLKDMMLLTQTAIQDIEPNNKLKRAAARFKSSLSNNK